MKCNYDISKQMQDDLIEAYKIAAKKAWTHKDACKLAAKMPAPRYYVSPKQAYQIIAEMIKGNFGKVDIMLRNRKRMYYSLYDTVLQLSEKRAFAGKSLWYIMPFAVTSPAPEFFISGSSVSRIRRWIRTGVIDDTGKTSYELSEKQKKRIREEKIRMQRLAEYRRMRKEEKLCREM